MDVSFTKTGLAIWFTLAIRNLLRKSRPVGAENLIPYPSRNKFVLVDEAAGLVPVRARRWLSDEFREATGGVYTKSSRDVHLSITQSSLSCHIDLGDYGQRVSGRRRGQS
jgi:hypothetical protein